MRFFLQNLRKRNAGEPGSRDPQEEAPLSPALSSSTPSSKMPSYSTQMAPCLLPHRETERVPRLKLGCLLPAPGRLTYSLPPLPDRPPDRSQTLPVRIPDRLARQVQDIAMRSICPVEQAAEILLKYGLYRYSTSRQLLECWQGLTRREQQVARLVALDMSIGEISQQLKLKPNTVRFYLKSAQEKFGVPTRREFLRHLSLLGSMVAGLVVDFGEDDESQTADG